VIEARAGGSIEAIFHEHPPSLTMHRTHSSPIVDDKAQPRPRSARRLAGPRSILGIRGRKQAGPVSPAVID